MKHTYRSITRLQLTAIALLASLVVSACSDKSNAVDIPVTEVPANIVSIVQNALPGISLTEAEKETRDETVIYELKGKLINGKKYEIEIAADGTIIEVELED